jgi:uncharacterized membrane protein YfcA
MLALPLWLWIVTFASGLIASTVTAVTGIGAGLIVYGILGFFFDLKVLIGDVRAAAVYVVPSRL